MKAILKALGVLLLAVSCNQKKDLGDKVYVTRIKDLGYVTHIDRDCEKLKSAKGVEVIEAEELSEVSLTCLECVSDEVRDTLAVFVERKLRREEEKKWKVYANPHHNFQKEVYDWLCRKQNMVSFRFFVLTMNDNYLVKIWYALDEDYYMPSFEIFKEDFSKNNPESRFGYALYSINSVKYSIPLYKLKDFEKTFPRATTGSIYVPEEVEPYYIYTSAEGRQERMRETPGAVFVYSRR